MRVQNWQSALDVYLSANADRAFSYDSTAGLDCCTFTFGAIHAQTGVDIGGAFRGTYRTRKESLRAMMNFCGRPSLALFISKLMQLNDFDSVPPNFAARGDAVLVPTPDGGEFLGILGLNGKDVISSGDGGLKRVPMSIRCKAWRIA